MLLSIDHKKRREINFFLWLIPVVNIINYYLTYAHISFSWHTALTFLFDTLEGYIAWLLVKSVIDRIDKKISYEPSPLKRIGIQLVLTMLAGLSSIILLTEIVNFIATNHAVPHDFYTKDIFIIAIWFFVINGIYVGLHYYERFKESEVERKKDKQIRTEGFKVSTPKKDLLLSFDKIAGFYIDGEYCTVLTDENKKFLVSSSLDKVEKLLPPEIFFRLNRQYIVHRQVITGFEKAENGKINVLLKLQPPLPSAVPVSRTKAPEFKVWMN